MELRTKRIIFLIIFLMGILLVSAATQKIYVDTVYNKTNIINVSNITALGIITQAGYRVLDTRDNASIIVSFITKAELAARSYKNGTEINQSIRDFNASLPATITAAVSGRDLYNGTQVNGSITARIFSANTSMWSSVVALDKATNTSMLSYITALIANYFTKSDIEALDYYNGSEVNQSIASLNASLPATLSLAVAGRDLYNGTQVNNSIVAKNTTVVDWTRLDNYPTACPSNTYVTTINDSVTCTGIADIYAFNNGDNLTGNYNFTGNTTRGDNFYVVFGDSHDGWIMWNGSALVIKVT